jgi:teichoic acid transport system ATP-binding protein
MNNDIAIHVKNLTKAYKLYDSHSDRVKEALHPFRKPYHKLFNALSDVSFEVKRGETVGVLGRNGSGKSTLLQIISGVLQPTQGSVETHGRISALLELGAGFNPEFTGRQNVYINASILGLSKEEIDARFPEILAFADIGDFIEQPMKIYSSGMYVRLAFAVAINVNPDILIVDEALAVGDSLFQAKCFDKFKEFQEKGITILFVTHALDLIASYCSVSYLLESGTLYSWGNPKEVIDEYNRMIVDCSKDDTTRLPLDTIKQLPKGRKVSVFINETQWDGLFNINSNEGRYGNGNASILEAGIFSMGGQPKQVLTKGERLNFILKVRFHKAVKDPIYAYTIRDIKGINITGSNSLFQKVLTGDAEPGDTFVVTFCQKMRLNQGHYLISFGCTGMVNGEFVVYERRYEYMAFEVVSDRAGVGFVDLAPDVDVIKLTS